MDEAVTGVPEKMLENREELTPMLSQYADLCEAYDDALVLFQVGDFYEAFCESAEETARVCEVTLTKREDSTGTYPMAGIPIDNAASYVEKLLAAGYRVALADQVEDADATSGLVDRAVTQVITPGTVVEDELLDAGTTTYVGAAAVGGDDPDRTYALALVDVSTGECLVTSTDSRPQFREELERTTPAELLVGPDVDLDADSLDFDVLCTDSDAAAFASDAARDTLSAYVVRPDSVLDNPTEVRACGAVLAYAEYTQGDDGPLDYVSRVTRFDPREYLQLDATAIRSLELFDSRTHRTGDTAVDVLDDTACALGRRRLTQWLRRPLVDRERIEARLDAVEEFTEAGVARETVRDLLAEVYDLERLIGRVSRERANARDLRSLKTTLDVVPEVEAALADVESDRLAALRDSLDGLEDVRDLVGRAIQPDPPQEITEGGVVREGFDDELDDLRATEREGRQWVADLEARERERTGIDSLEVGYNQVHGYYIEVTNPNLDRVPDDYTRRQTLKNSERFYTPDLKQREDEILRATERADSLEYDLFCTVRNDVAAEADRVQALAEALSGLDVLATLAAVAVENEYTRPTFGADGIDVEAGRHPVVEQTQTEFVPNGADFTDGHVAVITGPNMSGKSTYMRQVALVVILAQLGSFVPADAARLPVVDRVFTRVGASDDIAGGQSTFMREMAELTDILHNATEDSLVLLDEVGRGTSTADGLAIAWATTEFVHDEVGATTLFATHYHDLTALAADRDGVFNLHFTADRDGDEVTFLHRVAEGASSSSYGVEVAQLAGVPSPVVDRARSLVESGVPVDTATAQTAVRSTDASETAETHTPADGQVRNGHGHVATNGETTDDQTTNGAAGAATTEVDAPADATPPGTDATADTTTGTLADYVEGIDPDASDDGGHSDEALAAVADELAALDVARTTPLEALNVLSDLKETLDDSQTR